MSLYLLPETESRHDGAGPVVETETPASLEAVVTLNITQALEREGLEVAVLGSPDGENWDALVEFPSKSYCGRYSIPIDFRKFPGIRHLRAAWKMRSWKRDPETLFSFYVELSAVEGHAAVRAASA
jgi:hypothetical protein